MDNISKAIAILANLATIGGFIVIIYPIIKPKKHDKEKQEKKSQPPAGTDD